MPLQLSSFDDLVNVMTTMLASNSPITKFSSGSVALALIQSAAACGVSIEQYIAYIYSTERLATCVGPDVDTYITDYGMKRLPAASASLTITATRVLTTTELLVYPTTSLTAALVQTAQNGVQFQVIGDVNQPAWDPVRLAYVFPINTGSIGLTVAALVPGSGGNVAANTITKIVSGLFGVNTVSNPAQVVNGADPESDVAVKLRFPLYLQSLKTSNTASIQNAILAAGPKVTFKIIEYLTFAGVAFPSGFTIVVDDGTGAASNVFLAAVTTNVNATRAAGSQFAVARPTNVPINVAVTVSPSSGTSLAVVQTSVVAAITTYVNGLGVGNLAGFAAIANVVQMTTGVFSYSNLTLNGATLDAAILNTQLARVGTITFV